MKKYKIENNIPALEEYKYLCESVGWTNYMNFEVVETSLKNSIHCITVKDNEQIVGMGRIVGDGAIYFYIQDIVVHPDYQKNGIGNEIMNILVEYLKINAPDKA
ncbi:MAG: GNAT family N-acetyltransferase, partial [Paenisporosarcina sp.]